jgi:type I restriction-modification system DNA methylase subunit
MAHVVLFSRINWSCFRLTKTDSGHTAAEFYTNRSVVHLMALMLEPQPGETVYNPTCGSGGMLIEAAERLKREGREYRTLKLYGQEINLMTSAMARMNLFMHGFEDFHIVRGDTLAHPHFHTRSRLQRFDVVLANPPYSIKQWNRAAWENDPYGRNIYGTPPQGRADYAFFQHIIASLKPDTGRCAILFPHGVLFRDEERHMREKLVRADVVECVVGLGPNLFYNSPMEACVVICRMNKPERTRGKILLINAVNDVTRERAFSFLEEEHIARIVGAYRAFADEDGFARVVTVDEVLENRANLNIPLYARPQNGNGGLDKSLEAVIAEWQESGEMVRASMDDLFSRVGPFVTRDSDANLPPDVLISGMKGLAVPVYDFSNLFESTQLRLGGIHDVLANQMRDLQLIVSPKLVLLEIDQIAKTIDLLSSKVFEDVRATMGLHADFGPTVSKFLESVVANNGIELRNLVGEPDSFDATMDWFAGDITFEELPSEIQSDVHEARDYVYQHGITATALLLWVVNILWLLHDRSFNAASSLTNTLLTLLIILKEMADKDRE